MAARPRTRGRAGRGSLRSTTVLRSGEAVRVVVAATVEASSGEASVGSGVLVSGLADAAAAGFDDEDVSAGAVEAPLRCHQLLARLGEAARCDWRDLEEEDEDDEDEDEVEVEEEVGDG